ncbi:precorrin-3B synthase [Paracoccus spongiarum]|uniref:Precorrin-3B synthase n=1 Tax=Paracoccus spongiarum TaxID=3064387 RepID=A0ABT9JB19_9RHOB|nr:precorrin-3B synthase [Paracoccus sp. 2205BS29-5]MDP5306935.1 precorrin-3B synthase [Paracoccus sp. 2205BS29-5]
MTGSGVQGWCPGALRPMESGDGWVVRIRPRGGRLAQAQARGIAAAARAHGNGQIDMTGRANLQLRGVTPARHAALIADLRALDLIDTDVATETRRNILVTPFADPQADRLAADLERALAGSGLTLPAKFGFAIDPGPHRVLAEDPADIRIERGADDGLILRAEGMASGTRLRRADQAVALAAWFLDRGGAPGGRGRMAGLVARGIRPPAADLAPVAAMPPCAPGPCAGGFLAAVEFGRMESDLLEGLATLGPLRTTPWRMLLVEGVRRPPALPGLILAPGDPGLRLRACPGAPACARAHAPTRDLARDLARTLAGRLGRDAILHVSGCAKGCGWPHRADVTLTATATGFDLIRDGRAGDPPRLRDLPLSRLPEVL